MQGITNALLFALAWAFLLIIMVTVGGVLPGIVTVGILLSTYWFFVFRGNTARAEKADQKLQATLIKTEKVIASGFQFRLFALFHRRQLIAITSSRFIFLSRSIFGGFVMRDCQWKDLQDVQLSENILPNFCGSKLTFAVKQSQTPIVADGIRNDIASTIYSFAQAQEQEWEEKNRIRSLEEKRASSGGMILASGTPGQTNGGGSILDDLERAKKLFDSNTISDAEYQEIKSKVLSRGVF